LDVLVVDDWAPSRELVTTALRRAGHEIGTATDGAEASRMLKARRPAIVLVEQSLAMREDWSLLSRLRDASQLTILVVMGPVEEEPKVRALNRGADDYLVKPVHAQELVARVGAHRRLLRRIGEPRRDEVYDDGLVKIHVGLRVVEVNGAEVALTPLEFRLLAALVRHRDRVVSRDELQEMAWHGSAEGGSDHVKLYVHYLRRKLADHTSADLIQTVRGFGYRLLVSVAASAAPAATALGS
jgi:two-component system alkaline phosphatase synthesis response regulator PhoP